MIRWTEEKIVFFNVSFELYSELLVALYCNIQSLFKNSKKKKKNCHVETRFACFTVAVAMHLAAQHPRMWHFSVIWRWRMIRCLVNRVLHTDCVIQASLASDTHAVTAAISHTPSPSLPETLIYAQKRTSAVQILYCHRVRLGQRVKREHKQERTSTRAAKRNEYVTHGADTCAVGGLGGAVSNGWPQGRNA